MYSTVQVDVHLLTINCFVNSVLYCICWFTSLITTDLCTVQCTVLFRLMLLSINSWYASWWWFLWFYQTLDYLGKTNISLFLIWNIENYFFFHPVFRVLLDLISFSMCKLYLLAKCKYKTRHLLNLNRFRWCGQDWIRSIVFSLLSVLLPAGSIRP